MKLAPGVTTHVPSLCFPVSLYTCSITAFPGVTIHMFRHCVSRCIVNACLGGQKDFPQLNSSLMSVLAKKDLVMNVYRDGQWGSFRHLPMKSMMPIQR